MNTDFVVTKERKPGSMVDIIAAQKIIDAALADGDKVYIQTPDGHVHVLAEGFKLWQVHKEEC